jgi:hypothetical protein
MTSSNATSPAVIWAPSATNPAVTPLTMRGTRTGLELSRMTGPAARNVLDCSTAGREVGYLRLDEGGITRGDFDGHD